MLKYLIFWGIGVVIGYYIGNKAWRDSVNNWVKKMSQGKGNGKHKST